MTVFTLALLLQTSPVPIHALALSESGLTSADLPSELHPTLAHAQADFKGDGRLDFLALSNDRVSILEADTVLWQSPIEWNVLQAGITDLNRDGIPEATLLVWRTFRPWPVDTWLPFGGRIASFHDATGDSCHLILIGWRNGKFGELWAGSALAEPVRSFAAADLNGDGLQELVTLSGSYSAPRTAPADRIQVWGWNGFGFSSVYMMRGTFDNMALVQTGNGHVLILVQ